MSVDSLTIALAQFAPQTKQVNANLQRMARMVQQAAKKGAQLIVFPELATTGYHPRPDEHWQALSETIPSANSERLAALSRQYQIAIVYGTLEKGPGGFYDSVVLLDGETTRVYRKSHVHWTENFVPGNELPVFQIRGVPLAVQICFEAAFPEAARTLALKGARLILYVSAVPEDFHQINRLRVQSRALDNQLFVAYCNQTGPPFSGGSLLADPLGTILQEAGQEPGLLIERLDLSRIDWWRAREKIYPYRRTDLYS